MSAPAANRRRADAATGTVARRAVVDALALFCEREATLADLLAVPRTSVAELRRGSRTPKITEALALARVLREHSARLQLAAETIVEATQADIARVATDAYDRAMREPDQARAVDTALQTLFDLCG